MITAISKQSVKAKKKEWSIYHNIGVQHDARRFSLIDNVLDGELNDDILNEEGNASTGVLKKSGEKLKTFLKHNVFRTYLFCWFSLYLGIFLITKLTR